MIAKHLRLSLMGIIILATAGYLLLGVILAPRSVGPQQGGALLEYMYRLDAARALRNAGKLEEAEKELLRTLQEYRDNKEVAHSIFEINFELAAIWRQRNDTDRAVEQYRIIIEGGGPDVVVRARLERAQLLAGSSDAGDIGFQELRALYEEFRNTPEVGGRVCVKLADEMLERGHYDDAVEMLAAMLQSEITTNATNLQRMDQQLAEAVLAMVDRAGTPVQKAGVYLEQVRRYPAMTNKCWSWLEQAGLLFMQAGEYTRARNAFNEIVRDFPGDSGEQASAGVYDLEKLNKAERAAATRLTAAGAQARLQAGENVRLISGDIAQSETWSPGTGVYVVTKDVAVRKSAALVIEPGTRIEFCLGTRLIVHGRLHAKGTADAPITFTSAAREVSFFDWEGVWFVESSGSTLRNAIISRARRGVLIRDSAPTISQTTITQCGDVGIEESGGADLSAGREPARVQQCEVVDNPGYGSIIEKSNMIVSGGRISGNGKGGLSVRNASSPVVMLTVISGNGRNGIECSDRSNAAIERAVVTGNRRNGVLVLFSSPVLTDCVIEHNGEAGCAWSSSSAGKIAGGTISRNGGGVLCAIVSEPEIEGCTISENLHYGVAVESGSDPTIAGNRFNSPIGPAILVKDISRPVIRGNHFPPKGTAIRHEGDAPLDAADNFWPEGVDAHTLIQQQVHNPSGKVTVP